MKGEERGERLDSITQWRNNCLIWENGLICVEKYNNEKVKLAGLAQIANFLKFEEGFIVPFFYLISFF